jgi:hypothetical protein
MKKKSRGNKDDKKPEDARSSPCMKLSVNHLFLRASRARDGQEVIWAPLALGVAAGSLHFADC